MLGFQTLACLHDIPVVRSSTNKIQDVYSKAKRKSTLIGFPCNVFETVADKSLKVALTIANPFVQPLSTPVRAIDDFTAKKIRQIESKYPAINTPIEEVMSTLNEKTEPVRNIMNSVKDTTTSTIEHGRQSVSNVATATVNKASSVVDTVVGFCEKRVPGFRRLNSIDIKQLGEYVFSETNSLYKRTFQSIQSTFAWFQMLIIFMLFKTKQINERILTIASRKRVPTVLQRLSIFISNILDLCIGYVMPDETKLEAFNQSKDQYKYFFNRANSKADTSNRMRPNFVNDMTNFNSNSRSQVESDEKFYERNLFNRQLKQNNTEAFTYGSNTNRLVHLDENMLHAGLASDTSNSYDHSNDNMNNDDDE